MNINTKIGEKVLLDLGGDSFTGTVNSIDKNYARIFLTNCENFQTKVKYEGKQIFFLSNIISITPIHDKTSCASPKNSISEIKTNTLNDSQPTNKLENSEVKQYLSKQNWCSVEECLSKIVVIDQNDSSYFSAIENLNNEHSIVLLIDDSEFGRHTLSSLISIYAPISNIVYLFDLIFLQKINKELRLLLEADQPKKITFDSKYLCDHLKYKHKLDNIDCIFDVLVSFLVTFKEDKQIDLISCIKRFFSLPKNYFKLTQELRWNVRPLLQEHKIYSAKKVIFLYKLYEFLLHEHLLKNFYDTCKKYSTTYCNNQDQVEVAQLMSSNDETADELAKEANLKLIFY